MTKIAARVGLSADAVDIFEADLLCNTSDEVEKLRAVVVKAKVVLTTAGPFEKYGQTLVKRCAEEGVSYADITGETDFFRAMIAQHDATAQRTGATIVMRPNKMERRYESSGRPHGNSRKCSATIDWRVAKRMAQPIECSVKTAEASHRSNGVLGERSAGRGTAEGRKTQPSEGQRIE